MTYSRVLLQKLCKNCPRPEKPFSNSKTISLYITYKNKLFKNQNWLKTEFWKINKLTEKALQIKKTCQITEWSYGKTLCRSLVIISVWPLCDLASFFDLQSFLMMVALLLLLCENVVFRDGDNFCKAFAGAQVNLSYHEWQSHEWYDIFTSAPAKALQKLSPSRKAILK